MRKPGSGKRLGRIKTGRWERQWSLTKAGITAGTAAATQMWGSAFLPKSMRQERNQRILSEQSQYLADQLGELKGSVVKIGQIMALYGEHILPPEVTDALRTLEEQTTAVEWRVMEEVARKELGRKYDDFAVDPEPIGAASLAQVHRALHRPSGRWVCLKIQYPGVAESIDSDLGSVVQLLKLSRMVSAGKQFDEWVQEVKTLLHFEVDYQREAAITTRFRNLLARDSTFVVPEVFSEYSTARLMVSSYESGFAVNEPEVLQIPQAERNRLGRAFLQLFLREVFEWGEIQTDPNFGNYRLQPDESGSYRIVLLDFGAVLQYNENFLRPVKGIILGSCADSYPQVRQGAIDLGMMQPSYPEEVHRDFADLCGLLIEPFVYHHRETPKEAINAAGEYRWGASLLPKRAAKKAAFSAMSKYFAVPPKEFAFLSRKLLGVYSFIAALDAEFDPAGMLEKYSG
jgi:predicted unusual protein kinase regulating ubiquinone biosynthesis (AarF/ABC1/UbiB family)